MFYNLLKIIFLFRLSIIISLEVLLYFWMNFSTITKWRACRLACCILEQTSGPISAI